MNNLREIKRKLKTLINGEYTMSYVVSVIKRKLKAFVDNKYDMPFLVLWMGTKCTLKCEKCASLIPYVKPRSFDMLKILEDLKKLLKVANIGELQVQGGEPFIHLDIAEFIYQIIKLDIPQITVSTNGVVVIDGQTIKALQTAGNKVSIRISTYKSTGEKRENFIKYLKENNISYRLYDFLFHDGHWFDNGGPDTKRNMNDLEVRDLFERCINKYCPTLADGRITVCGRGAVSRELFNCEMSMNDELDLRNRQENKTLKKMLAKVLSLKHHKSFCYYCLGSSRKIMPGLQLDHR